MSPSTEDHRYYQPREPQICNALPRFQDSMSMYLNYQTADIKPENFGHFGACRMWSNDNSNLCLQGDTKTLYSHGFESPSGEDLLPPESADEQPKTEKTCYCNWIDCYQTFESNEVLVSHIQTAHVDKRRAEDFVCLWVGCHRKMRPFNARYKLLMHMRVHSGEKPNKCPFPECPKAFSRLENLKIHLRSHTGEKPYACQFPGCSKTFSNSSDRAKHQRTHIDTKPYACAYTDCSKRYTDPSSLRKHLKNHVKTPAINASVETKVAIQERIYKNREFKRLRLSLEEEIYNTSASRTSISDDCPPPLAPLPSMHNSYTMPVCHMYEYGPDAQEFYYDSGLGTPLSQGEAFTFDDEPVFNTFDDSGMSQDQYYSQYPLEGLNDLLLV